MRKEPGAIRVRFAEGIARKSLLRVPVDRTPALHPSTLALRQRPTEIARKPCLAGVHGQTDSSPHQRVSQSPCLFPGVEQWVAGLGQRFAGQPK